MERPSIAQAASMAGLAGSGRSLTLITGIADCCAGRERLRERRTANQRDELEALH